MNIEQPLQVQELRWPTINTRLAAALLVYGYQLCKEQPFIRIFPADKPDRLTTSIWFTGPHPAGVTEALPEHWGAAWESRRVFERGLPPYSPPPDWQRPLTIMRRALDKRQEFLTSLYGKPFKVDDAPSPFQTSDLVLAICLFAMGLKVYEGGAGGFIFDGLLARPLHQQYLEDGSQCAIQWMKRVILQQEILVGRVKQSDVNATIHMKVGSRIALVPAHCPPSIREPLVRLLYT